MHTMDMHLSKSRFYTSKKERIVSFQDKKKKKKFVITETNTSQKYLIEHFIDILIEMKVHHMTLNTIDLSTKYDL